MKRPWSAPPEPFSLFPLVTLLPARGKVGKLEALSSSLFARHEKVTQRRAESKTLSRSLNAEEAMLALVLNWLAIKTDGTKRS